MRTNNNEQEKLRRAERQQIRPKRVDEKWCKNNKNQTKIRLVEVKAEASMMEERKD